MPRQRVGQTSCLADADRRQPSAAAAVPGKLALPTVNYCSRPRVVRRRPAMDPRMRLFNVASASKSSGAGEKKAGGVSGGPDQPPWVTL